MKSIFYYFRHPNVAALGLIRRYGAWIPDKIFLEWQFRLTMGYRLDLNNPKTFSEKLQWLKLYDRRPEYTMMVDKVKVKEYVASVIGPQCIIPTLGVWDRPEEIEWDKLPDKFVLKCTHDSGGLIICKNKSTIDKEASISKLKKSLLKNYYLEGREWPYRDVPRHIIAEKYIEPQSNTVDLPDYKWYCFNGEPKFCQVIQNRSTNETIDFFDINWIHQEFIGLNPKACYSLIPIERPVTLATQIHIAKKLSKGIPFSRVDLYSVENKVYFGEITFYPMSGMGYFYPKEYNRILGDQIKLPINIFINKK